MDINKTNIEIMTRSFETAWQNGLDFKPPIDLSFLFTDFPSTTASNFYAWMDRTAKFREWVGDRVFNNIRSNGFQVINRHFEKSERMKADTIEDDQYGVYAPIITMHGQAWVLLRDGDIVVEVLTGNPVSFTGKAMLATDHAYGNYTISNLVTDALSKTSFEAAFTNSAEWKYSNGELIKPMWTHLVHGPKLHSTAHGIVDAQQISDGSGNLVDNPNYKRCKRVELPDLAGDYDDYWYLIDASKPIKPVARQVRKEARTIMSGLEQIVRTGNFDWMSDGRLAAAPTFPHLSYGGRL